MSSSKSHARASLWRLGNLILPLHQKYASEALSIAHWNEALLLHDEFEIWHRDLTPRLNVLHATPPHVLWLQSVPFPRGFETKCPTDMITPARTTTAAFLASSGLS